MKPLDANIFTASDVTLYDWKDDDNKYSHLQAFEKRQLVQNRSIAIRDMNGTLILPDQYEHILLPGEWVLLNCYLKSYENLFSFSTHPY